MRVLLVLGAVATAVGGFACSSSDSNVAPVGDGGVGGPGADSGGGGPQCPSCVTSNECGGGAQCVELGVNAYCMAPCGTGGSCTSGTSCVGAKTFDGKSVQVCVPSGECGAKEDGGAEAGLEPGDASMPYDGGGGQVMGTVGANGGTLSRLLFAVVGDTRPANYEDVGGYPTATITKIFQDIEAFTPKPPFVLATGDYQFASSGPASTASQQLDLYVQARHAYTGVQFPVMGNHECTGSTNSNCGPNNTNGITANYSAFMTQLLGPIQKTLPYYVIHVNATDGSWTSKFVFIAANAWDDAQATWLTTTMGQPTTYTFVVRHEPPDAKPAAPGQAPSETILNGFSYTLELVGHSHTYGHYTSPYPREVIIGNGGAPITNPSKDYGFAIFDQRSDGAIVGDMINYKTGKADSYFHFAVKADGTLTQ